jgi:YidC/Oxa1 family membrane protein insertase
MALIAWLLVIEWNQFSDDRASVKQSVTAIEDDYDQYEVGPDTNTSKVQSDIPILESSLKEVVIPEVRGTQLIIAKNEVLEIAIDTYGGDIVGAKLLKHLDKKKEEGGKPLSLLQRSKGRVYEARSGIIGDNATDTAAGRPQFYATATNYEFNYGDEVLNIDLLINIDGVKITKRFQLNRDGYDIKVQYLINNSSLSNWSGSFYGQIKRDSNPPSSEGPAFGMRSYWGAALREPEKNYSKYTFDDLNDGPIKASIQGGWVAMLQHYFVSAWIPPSDDVNNFSLRKSSDRSTNLMSFTGAPIVVPPGGSGDYHATFYIGPKDQKILGDLATYLDRTIDYGWAWVFAQPLFWVLDSIYDYVGNWGWSIILLTILVKMFLYPLSAASLRSMAKMRNLQPQLTRLKELYGDDRQKMSQEMMALYKKEKVNPAGGCLPMLLQFPIFISLYWVLFESYEIRHAPWLFWIQDLSTKDPYFVLPILMGGSMFLMQKLQPMPTDPMQANIMRFMPIALTIFMLGFPSGLVLYWTINNLLSMAQQWYVNRQMKTNLKAKP